MICSVHFLHVKAVIEGETTVQVYLLQLSLTMKKWEAVPSRGQIPPS